MFKGEFAIALQLPCVTCYKYKCVMDTILKNKILDYPNASIQSYWSREVGKLDTVAKVQAIHFVRTK